VALIRCFHSSLPTVGIRWRCYLHLGVRQDASFLSPPPKHNFTAQFITMQGCRGAFHFEKLLTKRKSCLCSDSVTIRHYQGRTRLVYPEFIASLRLPNMSCRQTRMPLQLCCRLPYRCLRVRRPVRGDLVTEDSVFPVESASCRVERLSRICIRWSRGKGN
jgi:hypothetical protein